MLRFTDTLSVRALDEMEKLRVEKSADWPEVREDDLCHQVGLPPPNFINMKILAVLAHLLSVAARSLCLTFGVLMLAHGTHETPGSERRQILIFGGSFALAFYTGIRGKCKCSGYRAGNVFTGPAQKYVRNSDPPKTRVCSPDASDVR